MTRRHKSTARTITLPTGAADTADHRRKPHLQRSTGDFSLGAACICKGEKKSAAPGASRAPVPTVSNSTSESRRRQRTSSVVPVRWREHSRAVRRCYAAPGSRGPRRRPRTGPAASTRKIDMTMSTAAVRRLSDVPCRRGCRGMRQRAPLPEPVKNQQRTRGTRDRGQSARRGKVQHWRDASVCANTETGPPHSK